MSDEGAGRPLPGICGLGERCCGCGACEAACPRGCVEMEPDELGFRRPRVDASRCVRCRACDRACPAQGERGSDRALGVRWAYARDRGLLGQSSSGGVFGLLAKDVLRRGGVVYGAAFAGDCRSVRHVRVSSAEALGPALRSKYVQSSVTPGVFRGVEADLRSGRPVLFCGTACQVAGMRGYLEGRHAPSGGLVLAEVACHGVPSPRLWSEWVEYVGEGLGSPVASASLRSKSSGWSSYSTEYCSGDGRVQRFSPHGEDWYMRAFLSDASLRGSCLVCPSKGRCGSDLTLCDFWGVQTSMPEVFEGSGDRGASAVIVRTATGASALERVSDDLDSGPAGYAEVLAGNPSLERPSAPHPRRAEFLADVASGMPASELVARWQFRPGLVERVVLRAKGLVKRIVGRK